jgi:CRISPR-associated endonuclease/helicase Cas3
MSHSFTPPQRTSNYIEFFKLGTGFEPYPYQLKFHQRNHNYAIHTLIAPTGLGKTECFTIDWLFGICHERKNTPSRLVISLPMRTLTHQTFARVGKILERLKLDNQITSHKLVGGTGEVMDRSWCNLIDKPIIIIGTQDQIISRQLFKGYATSRWEWPIHAALLNNDVRIIVDETQLQGVGYLSSVLLQKFAVESGHFGKRELVLCSATLDANILQERKLSYQEIGLENEDRSIHCAASQKINFLKRLHHLTIPNQDYLKLIAQSIFREHIEGTLSLCIVNTVDDAIKLMEYLSESGPSLKLLHSRFRGYERMTLCADLDTFRGIVIATQVIEAGIDLDARKLFTMPCPWASFVQRCGRAGRNATYNECDVYLIDIEDLNPLPYDILDLKEFRKRFEQLSDVNISTLLNISPPKQSIKGKHLTLGCLTGLFDTHPKKDTSIDDVSQYIRGEIDDNLSLMWRDFAETPDPEWRYREEELCRISPKKFYKLYTKPVWVWNNGQECWDLVDKPRSNQIVLLPSSLGGYSDTLGFTGNADDLPSTISARFIGKSKNNRFIGKTTWVTLSQHSSDARNELLKIAENLHHLNLKEFWNLVIECAQWHDLGKAHPQFQDAINNDQNIWAKAPVMKPYQRSGFRHELASAIGALLHDKSFLFAYILAAHHGKVRVHLDNFYWFKDEEGFRGLKEGDKVHSCLLGGDPLNKELKIDEFLIEFPDTKDWKQCIEKEIESLGVFKLSYLETLVRIADWRASALREI